MEKITERDLAELKYLSENGQLKASAFNNSGEEGNAGTALRALLDINGDGEVDEKDIKALKKFLASADASGIDERLADVNGDGAVNVKDLAALKKAIADLRGAK